MGGPAAPEMRAMILGRRNLPAIRDSEMRAASFIPLHRGSETGGHVNRLLGKQTLYH